MQILVLLLNLLGKRLFHKGGIQSTLIFFIFGLNNETTGKRESTSNYWDSEFSIFRVMNILREYLALWCVGK